MPDETGFLDIAGGRLEYRLIGPRPELAPTLVLLHEGLGALGQWDAFPEQLADATGAGVLAYSRAGYGRSTPVTPPWSLRYLHDAALTELPLVLAAIGFRRGLLIGHSDGASIATIYTGSVQDHRVRGLALIAPHFFVEDIGLAAINRIAAVPDLIDKLGRVHADPAATFGGWSGAWLDPAFRALDLRDELAHIRVPVLIVQGEDDRHGTMAQIEYAQQACYCPVEVALLPETQHVPHREAPEATLTAIAAFVNRLLRDHAEAEIPSVSY